MFLKLNHQQLNVYTACRELVSICYHLTNAQPPEERYCMTSQISRAALSVHLNIAEGSSRKFAAERKRYYEIARGSLIEIDAALDVAYSLGYLRNTNTGALGEKMIQCFRLLTGMIK